MRINPRMAVYITGDGKEAIAAAMHTVVHVVMSMRLTIQAQKGKCFRPTGVAPSQPA